ncbi:DNA repair protein complementing XP-C cells homolog [Culicoides brevitarsis]|uniref:DNA repair protein complementing XP-C cells homolog n=1 Tax=Culicoides brevitarsis TaxID=469753 RepID=UPI00307C6EDD
MSDEEEEWMSSEDDGDFSVSEDEWLPGSSEKKRKSRNDTMDSESDLSEEDEEDIETEDETPDSGTPVKMTRKQAAKRGAVAKKKSPAGVRKLFSKYKAVPEATTSTTNVSTSLSDILKRSQFQSKKLNSSQTESSQVSSTTKTLEDDDESSSSGDEHLVPADQINLNSDFFNVQPSTSRETQNEEPPDFDCNYGIEKSDESEEENDSETEFHGFSNESMNRSASKLPQKNKKKSQEKSKIVDLQELHNFNKNLEDAKKKLEGFQSKNFAQEDVNVSQLLAMGEESAEKPKKSKETKSNKRKHEESGSDWEEVEDELDNISCETQSKDLQITVELPGHSRKRTAKEVDIEAQIKRKLNNIKKINQVYMHKVHLLCWIAYGNRVNKILNSPGLYKVALKTLPVPAKPCYPKDKTDIKYFENISTWFRQQYSLTSQSVYPTMTTLPPLETSLTLQISNGKKMICKRDFCMAFIVLLRAMGFQARLVMSITGIPLKPPSSELCSLSKSKTFKGYKKQEEDNVKSPSKKTTLEELKKGRKKPEIKEDPKPERKRKAPEDPKKSKKKRQDEPKLEQLDGANDTPPPKNRQKPSTSTNSVPSVDSPFKKKIKGNTNGSPSIKLDNFAPPMKPKIKRLSEVPTFDVAPSPLKTRRQRQQEGSAPKMPAKTKVTKTTSLPISNTKPETSTKKSPSILKTQTSSKKDPNSRKSVSFESPKPSTSKKSSGPRGHQNKKQKIVIPSSDDEDLFEPDIVFNKPLVNKNVEKVKKIDRRMLSSDEDTPKRPGNKKNHVNVWVEVYAEKEKRWITVDLFKGKVDCVDVICQNATSPITYVLAWNNDNSLKDVSPRYCEHWNTVTRKLRVEKEWWDETIQPYLSKHVTERDKAENKYFEKIHSTKPMPTAISDFKNHPLYALERHLLKFEALYPPDAQPIGWIRNEPVYPRDCVYTLLTREKWVKEARVVKLNEEPYKIVTSPKWDKYAQKILKNCPVELFGIWQTAPYEPPTAENGIVPRNEYGNVELFKECMLPKKTVHLKFAGLNKVCKKLNVDCAPAIVGFDFHNGWSHPVYDGFVVCEEFEELVTNAWIEEQDELMKKEREKIEKRVYGNWRKLIKGLLIKKRLQARYNFEADDEEIEEEEEKTSKKSKK